MVTSSPPLFFHDTQYQIREEAYVTEPMIGSSERLDIVNDDIRLIQKTDGLTFGTDALLLASYIDEKPTARAAELGGGSGIITLLVLTRHRAEHVTVFEVQPEYADLITRNAALNDLSSRITVRFSDIRAPRLPEDRSFRFVFTNPPYTRPGGIHNRVPDKTAARHEIFGGIGDFCRAAGEMLTFGGHFYAVYRPDRLADLFCAMRDAGIEPKRMTFVHPDLEAPPCLVLVKGRRGGGASLTVTPPLCLYTDRTHLQSTPAIDAIMQTGQYRINSTAPRTAQVTDDERSRE